MRGVSKVYDGGSVGVERISFEVDRGEFVFLVGPTGCGKSTCMRLLMRELEPDKGHVLIAGRDIGVGPATLLQVLLFATDRDVDRRRAQQRAGVVTDALSGLTYDGNFHYNWQTSKSWSGTCRRLTVKFLDLTSESADFQFK